jgi:Golgi apyrase
LKPLLDFATEVIPNNMHKDTPLFLFATAGMRLVPLTERNAIMKEACSFSRQNYQFYIDSCASNFRTISGELEGFKFLM